VYEIYRLGVSAGHGRRQRDKIDVFLSPGFLEKLKIRKTNEI
jgi:hypothetical protein